MSEHIITTNKKATRELIEQMGSAEEVPISFLRRKLGKYKVRKAFDDLDNLGRQASESLRKDIGGGLAKITAALGDLDADLRAAFEELVKDFSLVIKSKKKVNGKVVETVRFADNVIANKTDGSVVFKVKK